MSHRKALMGLSLFAVFVVTVAGLAYAIPGKAPRTSPGLVNTYSEVSSMQ